MKVLLVEHDLERTGRLTAALRRDGCIVLTARDGPQALQRCEADHPDLVLIDVRLPALAGFEVCPRIRHTAQAPIILLAGPDEQAEVVRGLQLGADDYLIEPFSTRQLRARLRAVLQRCETAPPGQPAPPVGTRPRERERERSAALQRALRRIWCLLTHRSAWQRYERYLGDGYAWCGRCDLWWE